MLQKSSESNINFARLQVSDYILLIIGREPPGDVGAVELADDDGGGVVQPAQGEPGRLPRHLQPRVQRRLRLPLAHVQAPPCWPHQQVCSAPGLAADHLFIGLVVI